MFQRTVKGLVWDMIVMTMLMKWTISMIEYPWLTYPWCQSLQSKNQMIKLKFQQKYDGWAWKQYTKWYIWKCEDSLFSRGLDKLGTSHKKNCPQFESIDNPGNWSNYPFCLVFKKDSCTSVYKHHCIPTGCAQMEVNDPGEWMSDGWTSDDNNTTIFDCFTPLHLQLSLHTIFIWRQPKENWIVTGESLIQLTFGYFVMSYLSKCWSAIQKLYVSIVDNWICVCRKKDKGLVRSTNKITVMLTQVVLIYLKADPKTSFYG